MRNMHVAVVVSIVLGALPLAASASGDEAAALKWVDLIDPEAQSFADPFKELSYEQLDSMRTLARASGVLESASLDTTRRVETQEKIDAIVASLANEGVDALDLLEQRWVVADLRKRAATGGNPNIDGSEVSLAGFAIPGPSDKDGVSVVYLVPQRGMCSHTPPPNPNQMIRARIKSDWQPSVMHEPVRLTGTLNISPSEHTFNVVDGLVPMRATFEMVVTEVETVETSQALNPLAHSRWAASIAERLTNGISQTTDDKQ